MNLFNIIYTHPIGTQVKLPNNEAKEISGYEWLNNTCNLIFSDGTKVKYASVKASDEE